MKRIILLFAALVVAVGVFGQTQTKPFEIGRAHV